MTFKKWFDDMEERYQASYGSYEQLLQEAFEAGAKQEREACAKSLEEQAKTTSNFQAEVLIEWCATHIRARGEA